MKLSDEERSNIIQVRLEDARNVFADAQLLLEHGSLRSAANRVYYAMFYAISALTIFKGRTFSKHTGVISYFQKEFVKTKIFSRDHGRAIQKAFEDRSEADYRDYLKITSEDIQQRIKEADALINAISDYVKRGRGK